MVKFYLASKSPRRQEILRELGVDFKIVNSDYEEDNTLDINPVELAKKHAKGKAKGALKNVVDGVVIGSDTFVVLNGKVLGKPINRTDAKSMLKKMSGREHEVITGVCFLEVNNAKEVKCVVSTKTTKVKFIDLSEDVLENYLNIANYMDKAGSYGIQDEASVFVDKIEGSISNVIGFPKDLVKKMLSDFD